VPSTLRNLEEDLENVGSDFDGAPDLEFRQERERGTGSAAASKRDVTDQVVAAINVPVLAASTAMGVVRKQYVPALRRTAAAIEADLASASAHARAR
jgi:hypothetical protein